MLKPLENRVVLRVKEEEEKSMGGIVLTSASQEKPQTAEVVAVGEGKTNHHGTLISPLVKVGDTVIFEKFAEFVISFLATCLFHMREGLDQSGQGRKRIITLTIKRFKTSHRLTGLGTVQTSLQGLKKFLHIPKFRCINLLRLIGFCKSPQLVLTLR